MAKRRKTGAPAAPPSPPPGRAPDGRTGRWMLALTLIIYSVLQMLYITATPLQSMSLPDNLPAAAAKTGSRLLVGIGPDEKEHFLYIVSLAERGAIPAPLPSLRRDAEGYVSYQAQHPPLFYALAVPFYRAARPLGMEFVWYLLRALCALCGAGVVVLSARAAREAFPDRPVVTLAAAPFVAFLPMFGHMTGCLSNEPLALLLGTAAWLRIVRLVRGETPATARDMALLGVLLGLAALTRLTSLLWMPAAAVALVYAARRKGGARLPWASAALCAACFAAVAAPWFVRNIVEYGTPVLRTFYRPLLEGITLADYLANPSQPIQPRGFPQSIVVTPLTTALWYASTAWVPFWLIQFYMPGGMQAAPAWQAVYLLIVIFALLLLFLNASRSRREPAAADPGGRCLLWAAGAAVAFCVLALLQQQFWTDWNVLYSPGRYIVAAVPATSLLFLFALSTLARRGETAPRALAAAIAVAMLLLAIVTVDLVRTYYTDNPRQPDVQPITQADPPGPLS